LVSRISRQMGIPIDQITVVQVSHALVSIANDPASNLKLAKPK
jgi:hypothetical protein